MMEALEELSVNAEIFSQNTIIYLHCCTLAHSFEVTVPSLPFLTLRAVYCHFSFINSLAQRRICVIPYSEKLLNKLRIKSPCVIEVLSSVLFEVSPFKTVNSFLNF